MNKKSKSPAPNRSATPKSPATFGEKVNQFFQISQRGSTVGREIRGGLVTFFAMAYILVLNPIILSNALPADGSITMQDVAAGTALVAGIVTLLMGLVANFPMALAAGLGLNAMVAFALVIGSGLSYQEAMGMIVWEGIIITLLVLTGFREAVFKAVPRQMKTAISVGIGLFIALVGLVSAGIVRSGSTPLTLGVEGSLAGWPALVFVVGFFLTVVLFAARVKGAILIGILSSTVLAIILQAFVHLEVRSAENPTGWGQTVPALREDAWHLPSFGSLLQVDMLGGFQKMGFLAAVLVIFSLMLADFFDTMGTMVAIGSEGKLLDKDGNPPRTKSILVIDSLAAVAGGLGGVSSNTSFVESSAGVGEGARTGLASVVTGVMFLLSIFLAPLVEIIPSEAASTALVFVGFLMMMQVADINWKDPEIAIPSFMTIIFMPFAYSISVGIGMGFITYLVVKLARGKIKEISLLMWVVSILFVIYFCLGPIQNALLG